jgi:hypothetical protein
VPLLRSLLRSAGSWLTRLGTHGDQTSPPTPEDPEPDAAPSAGEAFRQRTEKRVEDVRDATRWLVTTFGAVGAILVAGLSLSSFSAIEASSDADHRLWVTAAGIALAGLGVVVGIAAASAVLTPVLPTVDSIGESRGRRIREFRGRPEYLSGYVDFEELRTTYKESVDRLHRAAQVRQAKAAACDAAPSDPKRRERAEKELAEAEGAEADAADDLRDRTEELGAVFPTFSYLITLRRFYWARIAMALGAVAIVGGVAAAAWGLNPPKDQPVRLTVPNAPSAVVDVDVGPRLAPSLRALIGRRCAPGGTARAILLGADEKSEDVVLLPQDGCRPVRLTVPVPAP